MNRRGALKWLAGLAAAGHAHQSAWSIDAQASTADRGTKWLLSKQGTDGGWRSETYGTLRGGAGVTAVVISTLSVETSPETQAAYEKGIDFLTARHDSGGLVVSPDGTADYGLYATALTARALSRRPVEGKEDARLQMSTALANAQSRKSEEVGTPDLGGWASLATSSDSASMEVPANISAAAAVLRASSRFGDRKLAEAFVRRCQNLGEGTHNDGGFFFTPRVEHPLNKMLDAATSTGKMQPVSYFPATCDGILALQALGLPIDAKSFERLSTLEPPRLLTAPPTSVGPRPSRVDGLFFYSAAAFAEVWGAFPEERRRLGAVRSHFLDAMQRAQRGDGSWVNWVKTMREDDPLIATSLAVMAVRKLSESGMG